MLQGKQPKIAMDPNEAATLSHAACPEQLGRAAGEEGGQRVTAVLTPGPKPAKRATAGRLPAAATEEKEEDEAGTGPEPPPSAGGRGSRGCYTRHSK